MLTYIHAYIHTYMLTYIHTYIHTYIQTYFIIINKSSFQDLLHINLPHVRPSIHTYIHTYIHSSIDDYRLKLLFLYVAVYECMYVYMYVGEVGMKRVASEISRQSTNEDDEGLCLQHAYIHTCIHR